MHSILFTGHMIDKPQRSVPRFPPSLEEAAKAAIQKTLVRVLAGGHRAITESPRERFQGIAAAACGGDILFQEACRSLTIPSALYLGIPATSFLQTSVAFAGSGWITRFKQLTQELPVHILHPDATADADPAIWEEANRWMMGLAMKRGADHMTLIALWDGREGQGPGGTRHMVRVAKEQGASVEIIDLLTL